MFQKLTTWATAKKEALKAKSKEKADYILHQVPIKTKQLASYIFLFIILALTCLLGFYADKFSNNTKSALRVPKNSAMDKTEYYLDRYQWGVVMVNPIYLKLEIEDSPEKNPMVDFYGQNVSRYNFIFGCHSEALFQFTSHALRVLETHGFADKIEGFYTWDGLPFTSRDAFLKDNARTTLLVINIRAGWPVGFVEDCLKGEIEYKHFGNETFPFEYWLNKTCFGHTEALEVKVTQTITSVLSMIGDMKSSVTSDLKRVDLVSIPLALICLMWCIRSVRLLAVPFVAIPVAVCLALGVNYPISTHHMYTTIAPEVISATVVALSIDFSLFFLTKLLELRDYFEPLRVEARQLEAADALNSSPVPPVRALPDVDNHVAINGVVREADEDDELNTRQESARGAEDEDFAISVHSPTNGDEDGGFNVYGGQMYEQESASSQTKRPHRRTITKKRVSPPNASSPIANGDEDNGSATMDESRTSFVGSTGNRSIRVMGPRLAGGEAHNHRYGTLNDPQGGNTVFGDEEEVTNDSQVILTQLQLEVTSMTEFEYRQFLVVNAVMGCSRNILFSSVTIGSVFLMLCNSSVEVIRTVSMGNMIGSLSCMFAVLCVAPVFLFISFEWLVGDWVQKYEAKLKNMGKRVLFCCFGKKKECEKRVSTSIQQPLLPDHRTSEAPTCDDEAGGQLTAGNVETVEVLDLLAQQRNSIYYKIAMFATQHPYIVLFMALIFAAPFIYAVAMLKVDFNLMTEVPTNSQHVADYHQILRQFSHNITNPFYLVFDYTTNLRDGYFLTQELIDEVENLREQISDEHIETVKSPFFYQNQRLTLLEVIYLYNLKTSTYAQYFDRLTMGQPSSITSSYIAVQAKGDPFTSVGRPVMEYLHAFVAEHKNDKGSHLLGFYGPNADSFTLMNLVYKEFPWQLASIVAIIFCAVFLVFRSLFIAIRLIFTVVFTVTVAFGTVSFVYCVPPNGIYPDPASPLHSIHAVQWIVPIISMPFMIALAVDYDAFLLTRFVHLRKSGRYTDNAAMVKAVTRTGRVISFAGLIMAFALGSLMVSHAVMVRQFGMLMFVNVVVDAFLVRPLIVPALVSLVPALLWFPRKDLPTPSRGLDDMSEANDRLVS